MEFSDVLKEFIDIGFKQYALEKWCNFPGNKLSEIYRGRTLITPQLIDQTIEGLVQIEDAIENTIAKMVELKDTTDKCYLVYELTFPDGKKYYGRTYNTDARWQNGKAYKTQKVGKAIEKVGWENVERRIIAENLTKENAQMIEHSLIKGTGTDLEAIGYNVF